MSFSFDPSLHAPRDHARLALGDTDAASPLLDDETLDAKLSSSGYLEAVAQLAEALATRFAQEPDRYSEGQAGLSAQWTQRIAAWRKLAEDCRSGRIAPPGGAASRPPARVGSLDAPDMGGMRTD
ncbi:MAG: hypothetical protein HYR64_03700 [Fimbriimonas ginsengisoli]|uniref:Uncharacterized protein n=1 Tax=Fimbriimonas ginsengisoli TaxID=1005039 RepID=A0A931PT83_FIMGI|nr:hypothetical protein [Fimbriimonas ginsengisoli]